MGYTTDFIAHIDIAPVRNDHEIACPPAFSQSPRCRRPGAYAIGFLRSV